MRTLLFLALFFSFLSYSQTDDKRTISGYIMDEKTGEKLIGATILDTVSKKGAATNEYGFFSLTIPNKAAFLRISYFGLQTKYVELPIGKDELNLSLFKVTEIDEVVVSAKRQVESSNSGTIELQLDKMNKLPLIFGEKDILRVLQLLPGIKSGGEASSGIYVRGGGPDQNLILLDGVPIYNASHLFGFFSTFNSDAISNVTMIKGGFPARYGGRASSVLDMRMKEGNMKNYNLEGSIGFISSRLLVEGPIKKDKTSFCVSARRTYIDALFRPFLIAFEQVDAGYFFHDFNAKIQHKINEKHHIYVSGYFGLDKIFVKDKPTTYYDNDGTTYSNRTSSRLQWGNSIGSVRWNYKINPKLFLNTTGTFSSYNFKVGFEDETKIKYTDGSKGLEKYAFGYDSGILDWGIKSDFTFIPNPNHNIKFGIAETYHTFTPGISYVNIKDGNENYSQKNGSKTQYSHEISLYFEDDFRISERFKVNIGLHQGSFLTNRKFYSIPQPRLSANLMLNDKSSIKFGISRMAQFLHLLSNTGIGLPTDLWVPATDQTKPVIADQISLSYYHELPKNMVFSVETYYKKMNNLIQYKEGVSFISGSQDWQQKVTVGQGWAYGAEFFVEKKKGKFTGWLGYTISWTERQFDELNFGKKFYYRYDRRHDLSLVLTYDINDKWDVGLVFVYGTGNAMTLGTQVYSAAPNSAFWTYINEPTITNFEQMNDYRMPAYHRMDIGANRKKIKPYGNSILSFSIYNVYNRQNPFMITREINENGNPVLMQTSLFPLIPSVSWKFQFDFEKMKKTKEEKTLK
ncbi:MAG: hypothetical protein RL264_1732 [Bacteroidota bacterium]|jgi:hypothetical protein